MDLPPTAATSGDEIDSLTSVPKAGPEKPDTRTADPVRGRLRGVRLFGRPGSPSLSPRKPSPNRELGATQYPPSKREVRLVEALRTGSRLAALVVLLGGAAVLLGWQLGVRWLQAIGPVDVVMNPLAALLFVLVGTLLVIDGQGRSGRVPSAAASALALFVATCGALVLMRSVAGWQVGIDEWLFRDRVLSVDPPDWMAANTALNFLLLGLALAARRVNRGSVWRPAHWLVLRSGVAAVLEDDLGDAGGSGAGAGAGKET